MAEEKMTGVEAVFEAVEGAPPDLLRELLEVIGVSTRKVEDLVQTLGVQPVCNHRLEPPTTTAGDADGVRQRAAQPRALPEPKSGPVRLP